MPTQASEANRSETYQPSIYAAAIITYIVAATAVGLRFIARRLTHAKLWYDDWLVVVALVTHLDLAEILKTC